MIDDATTIEDLSELTDDALATLAMKLPEDAKRITQLAGKAALELRMRMVARDATKIETENWTGGLRSMGFDHAVDDDIALVEALAPHITEAELARVRYIPPTPSARWDMRALNELVKRGGAIREAIEAHRRSTPVTPVLELTQKKASRGE